MSQPTRTSDCARNNRHAGNFWTKKNIETIQAAAATAKDYGLTITSAYYHHAFTHYFTAQEAGQDLRANVEELTATSEDKAAEIEELQSKLQKAQRATSATLESQEQ